MPFESISSALDRSGFLPGQYKLASFVLAGAIAGIAGYLNAAQFSFVSPVDLSQHRSGEALMIMILGGTGMLFGPIVGAFAMVLLEDWLAGITEHGPLVIGVFVILTVVLLPNGIAGLMVRAGSSAPVGVREDG